VPAELVFRWNLFGWPRMMKAGFAGFALLALVQKSRSST
jgi:hypothetical protein